MKPGELGSPMGWLPLDPDPDVDFNGDGVVGIPDFNFYRTEFGGVPGPSGYSCAGTVPCP
jgi:hypothetical protein